MDNQVINSQLPLEFGEENLFGLKIQSHALTADPGQSTELAGQPEQTVSQKYATALTSIRGSYIQSREKLGEMLSALQNIVNLNCAISKNRLGKVGTNVEKASKMVTQNGEKITKMIEDFHTLLTFDSIIRDRQVVRITSLIETVVQAQYPFVGEKGIHLIFESEIDTRTSVYLSPQLLSFLLSQTIERTAFSVTSGAKICISLTPSSNESTIDLHIVYLCTNRTVPIKESISARPLGDESNPLYQKYGIISELLHEYVEDINGKISIHIHSDQHQQITLSLPIQPEKEVPTVVDLSLSREQKISSSISHVSPRDASKTKAASMALLIGDNHDLYTYISTHLPQTHTTKVCRCAAEALKIFEGHQGEMSYILCFGELATSNNLEVLSLLMQRQSEEDIPVFLLTYDARASQKIKAQLLGARQYFLMPNCAKEILNSIQSSLLARQDAYRCQARSIAKDDLSWLIHLENFIDQEMGNQYFNLGELAYQLAISERQLFRKVKELTGKTPNKYLRDLKLHKARTFLQEYAYKTVAEISYAVGFQDPHYFSKIYKSHFGKWPSEYLV